MKTIYLIGCVKRDISRWVIRHSPQGSANLTQWYCGITHVENTSKLESYLEKKGHRDVHFKRWLTNDLAASQEILSFFIKNGMVHKPPKGKPNVLTRFVYVCKIQPPIIDEVIDLLG